MIIKKLLGHNPLFFLTIISTGLLTWASLAKIGNPVGLKIHMSDKLAHFIAYFILMVVWFSFLFFSERLNKSLKQSLWIAAVVCFLYGILMEVLQALLTTYRSSEWYDVIANTTGTVFAVLIIVLTRRIIFRIKLSD